MRRFSFLVAGMAVVLAGVAITSSDGSRLAASRWAARDLGTLGGKESYAAEINGKGVVVGWAEAKNGDTRPALWRDGRISDLDTGSGWSAWATEINDHGQVIGLVHAVWDDEEEGYASSRFGFVWERGSLTGLHGMDDRAQDEPGSSQVRALNERGKMVGWVAGSDGDIPYEWNVPTARGRGYYPFHDGVPLSKTRWGRAYDINERGQVVGESYRSWRGPTHAASWQNGKVTDLGTLPGRTQSSAVAVNDRGLIIGSSFNRVGEYGERKARMRAFLWQKGKMLDLGTIAGLPHSSAVALNESGQVVGWSAKALGEDESLPKSPRAFLWQDGRLTDLGTLGGASAIPFATSERGVVVGQSQNARGEWQAFVWSSGKMTALPTLGGKFSAALAINDEGWIVGWSRAPKNVKHAVLWTLKG